MRINDLLVTAFDVPSTSRSFQSPLTNLPSTRLDSSDLKHFTKCESVIPLTIRNITLFKLDKSRSVQPTSVGSFQLILLSNLTFSQNSQRLSNENIVIQNFFLRESFSRLLNPFMLRDLRMFLDVKPIVPKKTNA